MKHLAAYLLLQIGGNASPTADDVKTALSKVGVECDDAKLSKLISDLEGKDVSELLEQGNELLAQFGGGGGGGGAGGGGDGGGAAEEEKEEEVEEEEMEIGGGAADMFGGGGDEGDY